MSHNCWIRAYVIAVSETEYRIYNVVYGASNFLSPHKIWQNDVIWNRSSSTSITRSPTENDICYSTTSCSPPNSVTHLLCPYPLPQATVFCRHLWLFCVGTEPVGTKLLCISPGCCRADLFVDLQSTHTWATQSFRLGGLNMTTWALLASLYHKQGMPRVGMYSKDLPHQR